MRSYIGPVAVWLKDKEAPQPFIEWAKHFTHITTAWMSCPRADWLIWWVVRMVVDLGRLTQILSDLVRLTLQSLPADAVDLATQIIAAAEDEGGSAAKAIDLAQAIESLRFLTGDVNRSRELQALYAVIALAEWLHTVSPDIKRNPESLGGRGTAATCAALASYVVKAQPTPADRALLPTVGCAAIRDKMIGLSISDLMTQGKGRMSRGMFQGWLACAGACPPAIEWVGDRDAETAWSKCDRAEWLLWLACTAGAEWDVMLRGACLAAREALQYSRRGDEKDAAFIEAVERLADGRATATEVHSLGMEALNKGGNLHAHSSLVFGCLLDVALTYHEPIEAATLWGVAKIADARMPAERLDLAERLRAVLGNVPALLQSRE